MNAGRPMADLDMVVEHSFECAHYENPALWTPERYAGLDAERARLTLEWLPPQTETILDVGCGNGLLTNRLQNLRLVVGLDRSLAALEYVQMPRCQATAGCLPFENESFDTVVSTELIEHLPFSVFEQALTEMVRVARCHLLISVPYREYRLYKQVDCPLCGCRFNPDYHLRSFDLADLERLFADFAVTLVRAAGAVAIQVPRFSRIRYLARRMYYFRGAAPPDLSVCPQCGYFHQAASRQEGTGHRRAWRRWLVQLARKGWPNKITCCWWIALYAKE